MAKNLYYYFKLRNGVEYAVKVTSIHINTDVMHDFYRELTAAEKDFYVENPTATVREIINCQLTPPYTPPAVDVQEYITKKLKDLKEACYDSVSVTSLEYAMANTCLAGTSVTYSGDKYYTVTEAKAVMKQFMDESKAAMTIYDTYKPQIEAAVSVEAIDTIYNEAVDQL